MRAENTTDPPKSQLIGHVFLEPDGSFSVTPTARCSDEHDSRLRAVWKHRYQPVMERLIDAELKLQHRTPPVQTHGR